MQAVTFEQVVSQINALPSADRARLRDYLDAQMRKDEAVEAARQRARACSARDLSAEYRWIKEHREEYAGQWVALKGNKLISHGPNGVEVMEAAGTAGHPDAFFKLILPAEELRYTIT